MAKDTFQPLKKLPVGAIKPQGWLKDELAQMNDLQKRLGSLPGLIKDGEWADGEALPRYARSLVLLSGVLDDKMLRDKVWGFVQPIVASANEGGDFGPRGGKFISPKIEGIKALMSYYELTGDPVILSFLKKYFKNQFNTFSLTPCWFHSRSRLLEEIPAIEAVYKQTDQEWLHDLAEQLRESSTDWFQIAASFPYKFPASFYVSPMAAKKVRKNVEMYENATDAEWRVRPLTRELADSNWKKMSHRRVVETSGVNVAKAVKYPATYGIFVGDSDLKKLSLKLIANLEKYHGTATGMFTSDTRLAGDSPTRGIDVESTVEMIESLVAVLGATGEYICADLLENIVYNVVPSAMEDGGAVQDVLQTNQVEASNLTNVFFKDNAYGNAYVERKLTRGAVSLLSAFPIYMQALCMQGDRSLNFFTYAPCTIAAVVDGVKLQIVEETGYPFRNSIVFKVESADGEPEVKLNFRVPKNTTMQLISGGQVVASGTRNISVRCVLKTGSTFMLKLDIPLVGVENRDKSVSLYKGSLLMAEKVVPDVKVAETDKNVLDMTFTKKWNVAPVLVKKSNSGVHRLYGNEQTIVNDFTKQPFNSSIPPFELRIPSKNVENWDYDVNGFPSVPKKPNFSEESLERAFVPFGCTRLRIAQFPPCCK